MKISRLAFIKSFSLSVAGAFVAAAQWDPFSRPDFSLRDATAATFRKYVHDSFYVRSGSTRTERVELVRITEQPLTRNVAQFSLIFESPAETHIADGIHPFEHPSLGRFDLFITRIGLRDQPCCKYQACFSRHV